MAPMLRPAARRLAAVVALLAACDRAPATAPGAAVPTAGPSAERATDDDGGPLPGRYLLPGAAVFPEGIAYDQRTHTVYVTSTTDGTVFRGDARDSVLTPFLPGGADGRTTAIGVDVDSTRQRLFVAGGGTGRLFVYDAASGALLANLANGASPTFVNDVAVAPSGSAYATDSQQPVIYRALANGSGGYTLQRWFDLTGTPIQYTPGFNLNGIEVTPDGRYLFVVQSNTGQLFRIDTRTRVAAEVDLGGERLNFGDGLLLRGDTLYAVQNQLGAIAEVRLDAFGPGAPRGRLVGRIADASFRYPTTVERANGRLLVVNAQFDRRGGGRTPELPFTVSVVTP